VMERIYKVGSARGMRLGFSSFQPVSVFVLAGHIT
jgi:hypothetical protein